MNSRKLKRDSGGTDADILLSRFTQSSPAKVNVLHLRSRDKLLDTLREWAVQISLG